MKSMEPPPTATGSSLTAEQLDRIAQNKKRALELRNRKRQADPQNHLPNPPGGFGKSTPGPPQSKRTTNYAPFPTSRSLDASSNPHFSSSTSSQSDRRSYLTPAGSIPSSASANNHGPMQSNAGYSTQSRSQNSNAPLCANGRAHQPNLFRPAYATSSSADHTSKSSGNPGQVHKLRDTIIANFVILSRRQFKVQMPYDAGVIEIFKRMRTRLYDARQCTWNFALEEYGHLVETLRKECKHVEMKLPPKPVISLLQSSDKQASLAQSSESTDWSRVESKLCSALMRFQREGVEYCLKRSGRVLMADDMGLGKTLQAIAVMTYYRTEWPLLVICPSSVRLAWAEAFHRWVPSLRYDDVNVVLVVKGSALNGPVNIISYDIAIRMAKELKERKFQAVIADESHFLKNCRTARYKAVGPVVRDAKRALLLSGTPALSRPIELFTQIKMLDRNFRTINAIQFGLRYCDGVKGPYAWNFSGASNMLELQLYMEEAVMIRRMKSDVLDQLPSKQRQMVLLDCSAAKSKNKDWKDLRQGLNKAGTMKGRDRKNTLLPLYEKTGRIKIPAIKSYILDLMEGGRKLIVFGHHRSVLNSVCETLREKGHEYIRIDGSTAADMRQTYCDQFQHDERCLVAVLSITAANAGLTLTAASTVVFVELFWNPGILIQAEDRAYRIGQDNCVNVHYLVAQDTADDFIWPMIQLKLKVLHQAGLAKDDFSKTDSTTVADATQRTLFDCFKDLIPEDELISDPVETGPQDGITSTVERSLSPVASVSGECGTSTSANLSNWFDDLKDDDFLDI